MARTSEFVAKNAANHSLKLMIEKRRNVGDNNALIELLQEQLRLTHPDITSQDELSQAIAAGVQAYEDGTRYSEYDSYEGSSYFWRQGWVIAAQNMAGKNKLFNEQAATAKRDLGTLEEAHIVLGRFASRPKTPQSEVKHMRSIRDRLEAMRETLGDLISV